MNRLNHLFTLMGTDGMKHFILSATMTAILALGLPWHWASLITLTAGLGKEVYDRLSGRGMAEWKDVLCNLAGTIIGAI
jgi:hypothetical protein